MTAKRLLVEGGPPGKQVARACGFPSTEQMWLTFRRMTGLSPTAFRNRSRRKGSAREGGDETALPGPAAPGGAPGIAPDAAP